MRILLNLRIIRNIEKIKKFKFRWINETAIENLEKQNNEKASEI